MRHKFIPLEPAQHRTGSKVELLFPRRRDITSPRPDLADMDRVHLNAVNRRLADILVQIAAACLFLVGSRPAPPDMDRDGTDLQAGRRRRVAVEGQFASEGNLCVTDRCQLTPCK